LRFIPTFVKVPTAFSTKIKLSTLKRRKKVKKKEEANLAAGIWILSVWL